MSRCLAAATRMWSCRICQRPSSFSQLNEKLARRVRNSKKQYFVQALVDRLKKNSRITVLTGAGVSAASGVPTFRGADGLWKNFRPEALATAEAFGRDPRLVWE